MAWNFSNGLLGMGGLSGGQANMPANSLLGQYYDPAEMRKYQMKQMLLGLGAGLMSEKGFGRGATMALAAGDLAGRSYRENALDAYKIKNQQDQQAKADQRYQQEWDWRVKQADAEAKRQAKIDAQNNTLFGIKMDEQQRLEDQRQGQQNYVTNWMDQQNQAGAGLPMSPGVRAIGRAGGVEGPSATDQWRYDNAQPYAGAQDFGNAFQQITAQPPQPDLTNDQKNFIYGQQNPAFRDYQTDMKKAGATNVAITPQMKNNAVSAQQAYDSLTAGLEDYKKLITQTGVSILPGQENDQIAQARTNLQLQLKELYNLGVLNGPDLSLMEQMIFDPQVGWNPVSSAGKIYSALGLPGSTSIQDRATASIDRLQQTLKTIVENKTRGILDQPVTTPDGYIIEQVGP